MSEANASFAAAYRAGEVLIQFDVSAKGAQSAALMAVMGRFLDDGEAEGAASVVKRLALGEGVSVEKAVEILSRLPGVEFVEPDYVVQIDAISNDTNVASGITWNLYGNEGSPTSAYGSQASEAWADGFTGKTKVAVGVLDTGVDYTHPDLYKNIWLNQKEIPAALKAALRDVDGDSLITFRDLNNSQNASYVSDKNSNGRIDAGDLLRDTRWENGVDEDVNGYKDDLIGWDFANNDNDPKDDNGHGTHVAGTIGATGGNGAGVAGIGWSTSIVALKFMNASAYGYTSNSMRALDYFTNASKAGTAYDFVATNNSWGGAAYSTGQLDAIVRGAKAQILYVAAAGNGGSDAIGDSNDSSAYYPAGYSTKAAAGYEAVISVAAITKTGDLAAFSNYGKVSVDLAAPGYQIYSTTLGGGYGYKHGTSMATPHVAGALALYAAYHPTASAAAIRAELLSSTISTASLVGKTVTGGRLDVSSFLGEGAAPPPATGGVTVNGTSGNDLITPTATLTGQLKPGAAADTLNGLAGNDTLNGGAGADRLAGGTGSDTYYVDNTGDLLVETTSGSTGGTDRVNSSVSFTLGANVERLTLTGSAAVNGAGNSLDNVIYGNGAANSLSGLAGGDVIWGYAGNDTLRGGSGADTMSGGAGADRFVFAKGEAAGDRVLDFGADDLIQLTGYGAGSTIKLVAGTTTDWLIRDGVTGQTELLKLTNGYKLGSGDFLFS
jgi:subtilisin family serine protease